MTDTEYNETIAYFLSFCVEIYKNAHSISGEEALTMLADSGALAWLENNYDVLHTQSHYWILEEINEYMSSAKISRP